MLKEYGYIRVAAAQNELHLCDVSFNTNSIIKLLDKAKTKGVDIICFPELSLVGYTAQDMFLNKDLYNSVLEGLNKLKEYSKKLDFVFIVGAPIKVKNSLYNCAISFCNGHIIGITPKTYIPNYNEFYEARWFSSANKLDTNTINLLGEDVLISNMLCYKCDNYDLMYSIDICEDLWVSNPPSNLDKKSVTFVKSQASLIILSAFKFILLICSSLPKIILSLIDLLKSTGSCGTYPINER